jgi:hypothetical protein
MKKIILLLLVLAFYSCGPSACDCDKHFNKYQSGLGSPQYKLDYNELQDCFKIAEKTGMFIQDETPVDSSLVSEFIEHDAPEAPKKERQKRTVKSKERLFELKIFGLKLFTIKY